jgi:hypothetical protein
LSSTSWSDGLHVLRLPSAQGASPQFPSFRYAFFFLFRLDERLPELRLRIGAHRA